MCLLIPSDHSEVGGQNFKHEISCIKKLGLSNLKSLYAAYLCLQAKMG